MLDRIYTNLLDHLCRKRKFCDEYINKDTCVYELIRIIYIFLGVKLMSDSIKELKEKILQFRNERDWKQFHNPKDLAISLSLEAAELLEVFQWSGDDLVVVQKKDKVKEELADVMIYSMLMAEAYGLDVSEIIEQKLAANNKKYPVEKAFGKATKYTELE